MKRLFFVVLFFSILGSFILWLIGLKYPTRLYSPGDLVRKHQGICICKSCHVPFGGISSASCQTSDCHPAERLLSYSVASINEVHKWALGKDCMECHTEHEGIDGEITKPFDHRVVAEGKMCAECHSAPQEGPHIYYRRNCEKCHTTERWKPATLDHTMVARVNCVICHAKERDKAHPGKYSNACEACHGTIDWKVLYFDHEELMVGERCVNCHNKPEDSLHYEVSNECKTCHSTKRWKPAWFAHIAYFPLADEHLVSCEMCHETKDYKTYTCTNCHVHNTKKIRHEHEEHGISDYVRCLDCHRVTLYGREYGTPTVQEEFEEEEEEEYHHKRRKERKHEDDEDEDD